MRKLVQQRAYPYQDRSLKDIKGEIWEDIPGLDGAYLISNFGRIKSLRRWINHSQNSGYYTKERILALRIHTQIVGKEKRKLYQLVGQVTFEGKKMQIQIARMVYCLFVSSFDMEDLRLVVQCKDGDGHNIYPENLVLTTRSFVIQKAYQLNHRKRTSFGNDAKGISQFRPDGTFLAYFLSVTEAAKATGIQSINKALQKKVGYTGGFIWKNGRYSTDLQSISSTVKKLLASKAFLTETPITRYDLQGRRLAIYSNVKAAREALSAQTYAITKALKGLSFTVRNSILVPGRGPIWLNVESRLKEKQKKRKKALWRPVLQLDSRGKKIKEYPSVAAAAREMQVHDMSIHCALKNDSVRHCKGFRWRYK